MRQFGLIGFPLGHSFSEGYFREKFRREGIADARYQAYPMESLDAIRTWMESEPNLQGFNITIPHKQAIIPHLDRLDSMAGRIGAVNTVRREPDGTWTGFNTDWIGFRNSLLTLQNADFFAGKSALILGTGGSSRAIAVVLQDLGMRLMYASRQPAGENQLAYSDLSQALATCTLVVNCSPLGTFPRVDTLPPLPYDAFHPGMIAFDLVYNPPQTRFLEEAQKRGCQIQNGLPMLIGQAEAAWAIWNGGA